MKDYENFVKINESVASELLLLANLYSFYLQKYGPGSSKFRDQIKFLEEQGEISNKSIKKFYKENNISIERFPGDTLLSKVKSKTTHLTSVGCGSSSSSVGCGSTPSRSSSVGCGSTRYRNVGC